MISTAKAASGILAGFAGSLAMHALRLFWDSATNNDPRYGMFGFDREADVNAARLVNAVLFSRTIPDEEAEKLGLVLHYVYGVGPGACYSTFAFYFPAIRRSHGVLFGGLLWMVGDEIAVSLSGVSHPFKKTAASHAAALAAHILFGVVVERTISSGWRG